MKRFYFLLLAVCLAFSSYGQRPVAFYAFDAGSLDDNSQNATNLESLNPVLSTEGYDGTANAAVNLSDNALFLSDPNLLGYEEQITVSTWLRLKSTSPEWIAIINKWVDSAGSYYLGVNPDNNSVRWNCFVGNIEDPTPLQLGEWVHYTATYEGQNIKLFRNGELVNSLIVDESTGTNPGQFRIGTQTNNEIENAYLDGDIDEVKVFNVALTEAEVADLYNNVLTTDENDLVLFDLTMDAGQIAGENIILKGKILNNSDNIASNISMEVSNGLSGYEEPLSGVSIAPHETYSFEVNSIFDAVLGMESELRAEVLIDNDANPNNNVRTESILGYSFIPNKKVVIEEGTGTWCGYCPRGALALEEAYKNYPDNFIGIAVHNDDPMTVDFYDSEADFGGYPRCHVNRSLRDATVNVGSVDSYIKERLSGSFLPAEVAISHVSNYDANTRNLIVVTTVSPAIPLEGFYAFSLIITEDGVTGTSQDYDQVNYFANNALGPMGGYETLPNPVPAIDMKYDHVARDIVGGSYIGNTSSILTSLEVGETYSFTHLYNVPDEFNIDNINLISLFINGNGGRIMNAESTRVSEGTVTASEDLPDFSKLSIYPNPSSGETNLELVLNETVNLEVRISTINGHLVQRTNYGQQAGFVKLPLDMNETNSGLYLVTISLDGYTITKKLVIR